MELFDVLPEHFFGLLAGKCRRIYAEAGLCLYEQYRLAQFGIEQEILRDKFQELIESWAEVGVAYEDESFSEKDAADESRAKANHMIRRMKEFGWLDYEQRENFKIFILLPHYSSRLWGLFANLCEGRAVEYQRFAFTTYQVLSGEAAKVQPSMAVLEAERLAEEFVEELRILLNNIKGKMEQVSAQTSLQDVLSHHFVEYRADIVDRSYHRLKTSDHVSRYRIGILREVQEIQQNKERMRALCDDAVRRELADSVEAAEYRMNASLQTIEEIYRGLDDMFAQIDRRHNQYVRASYERALYLQQAGSARTESMIAGVLLAIAEAREEGSEVGGCRVSSVCKRWICSCPHPAMYRVRSAFWNRLRPRPCAALTRSCVSVCGVRVRSALHEASRCRRSRHGFWMCSGSAVRWRSRSC